MDICISYIYSPLCVYYGFQSSVFMRFLNVGTSGSLSLCLFLMSFKRLFPNPLSYSDVSSFLFFHNIIISYHVISYHIIVYFNLLDV